MVSYRVTKKNPFEFVYNSLLPFHDCTQRAWSSMYVLLQSKSGTYEKRNICATHAVIVFIHHSITLPLLFFHSLLLGRVSSVLLMRTAKSHALRNGWRCACLDFRKEHKPLLNSTYLRTGTTVPTITTGLYAYLVLANGTLACNRC